MNRKMILQVALLTFIAAPLNVLFHELAHILGLSLSGVPARLVSLGSATPVGFDWNFEFLRAAQMYYGAGDTAIVIGALAGPLFTLAVGFIGFYMFRRTQSLLSWSIAYSAVGPRSVVNLLFLTPKVIDGSITSSDEAIAAYFLGWPLWSLWWLLAVGVVCTALLIASLPKHRRYLTAIVGFISSFVGFFLIEYIVNIQVFNLDSWDR